MTYAMAPKATEPVEVPSFNLWHEPWIGVIQPDGSATRASIAMCLMEAHRLKALHDSSPLVVAGIHRLLAAILQDIYRPQRVGDLAALLQAGQFDPQRIAAFGAQFDHCFDLFSPSTPFLQTADASLTPGKKDNVKTIAHMFYEEPAGTAVVHYQHRYEDAHQVCPACAAGGLVAQPAFATAVGRGFRPSINGVPPCYVFPVGATLFEALTLSLITPSYQPKARDTNDSPAWTATPIVERNVEVTAVGYLQSLTFPARRVRLHPQSAGVCTRCGYPSELLVATMLYEMGLSRPKAAPHWQDPFAAYIQRGDKPPTPVRPQAGKALWREYNALFLGVNAAEIKTLRPPIIEQIDELVARGGVAATHRFTFRCIGMRTDMKAKIFEWIDGMLDLPVGLLRYRSGARLVRWGIERAEEVAQILHKTFQQSFHPGGKRERFQILQERMATRYWTELAGAFREFILVASEPATLDAAMQQWIGQIVAVGTAAFEEAVESTGDRGEDLRRQVQAVQQCRIRLAGRRKEWLNGERAA